MMFSKHMQDLPPDEVGRRLKGIGIDHVDLTVRDGGHVAPERALDDLPRAAEALGKSGVKIGMLTTQITSADSPHTEPLLRTAAALGVRYYKLGYFTYRQFGSLRRLREEALARLRDLAAMNMELGIKGGYHNHSGSYLGANLHDISWLMDRLPHEAMGAYFDGAHSMIEGSGGSWKLGIDLLGERIIMLAVKDFYWSDGQTGLVKGRRHTARTCPLEQGQTRWPEMLTLLNHLDFNGPVSLHSEYQGAASFQDLTTDEVIAQTAKDKATFEKWIADCASA